MLNMLTSVLDSGPKIVTNGLLLNLDAAQLRSYPGSGTTWTDLSGNSNNSVLTNGPTFNSSNGGSIVFDGVNDYVVVNNNANILNKTAYTKAVWFRISSFSTNNNLISGDNASQHAFWLFGSPYLQSGHNGSYSLVVSTTSLSLNTWYFGAVTFSTTSGWVLYVNGVSESTNASTTTYTGNDLLLIGAYVAASNLLTGRIACAYVYNRALSSTEILQNYNAVKSRFGL